MGALLAKDPSVAWSQCRGALPQLYLGGVGYLGGEGEGLGKQASQELGLRASRSHAESQANGGFHLTGKCKLDYRGKASQNQRQEVKLLP